MSTKVTYQKYKSPRGVAVFPKTRVPVLYNKALKKSEENWKDGKFELKLALEGEVAEQEKNKIIAFAEAQGLDIEEVKNWPFSAEKVKDEDGKLTKTGRTLFNFKGYATKRDGSKNRIVHFNAAAKPLALSFVLTGGSEVKVTAIMKAFKELGGGVSLVMDAVQVLKYAEMDARNPGFDAEDGYMGDDTAADEDETPPFDTSEDEGSPSNSTDF